MRRPTSTRLSFGAQAALREASKPAERPGAVEAATAVPATMPLWRRIANDLETMIADAGMAPGDRLPTEAALAEKYDVARQTVRIALADLTRRGIVRGVPRAGTFVSSSRLVFSIEREVRLFENVLRAGREPSFTIVSIEQDKATADIANWLQIAPLAPVIRFEGIALANNEPVCHFYSWFPGDRFPRIGEYLQRLGDLSQAFARYGIKRVERRFSRVTSRMSTEYEREKLKLREQGIVMVLSTVFVDGHGEPVEAIQSCFDAERTEFSVPSDRVTEECTVCGKRGDRPMI